MWKFRLAAIVLALAPLGSHAGLFDDKEARAQIATTRQDLQRLQEENRLLAERLAQVENSVKGLRLTDVINQQEALRAEVAGLRGQFELQTYQIEQLQKRQKDLYTDLDVRLRALEEQKASAATAPAAAVPETASEEKHYGNALELYKKADFAGAAREFEAFGNNWPTSRLAGNALYWAASAHAANKDCRSATPFYQKLLSQFPDSSKTPEALLGLGSCQRELKDLAGARATLQQLVKRFPATPAGEQASRLLDQMPRTADKPAARTKGERR